MAPDQLTVTLTARPPVKITKDSWPIIASSRDWEGEHEFQSFRKWKLFVRQHEDGRAIVYGIFDSNYRGEGRRGGELLGPGEDICAAIQRVGEYLGFQQSLMDDCIADLPAVDIDEPT